MIHINCDQGKPGKPITWQAGRLLFGILPATLLAMAFLSSCATAPHAKQPIVWPMPPEQPRIAYVRSYHGETDFKKTNILNTLIGKKNLYFDFGKPYGVAASDGRIYVTDTQDGIVWVMDSKTKKVSFLGAGGEGKLATPAGVAVTAGGRVFVSDASLKRIFCFNPHGRLVMALGYKGEFKIPAGLAINNKLHRLYVVDSFGHDVHVFDDRTGKHLFTFGKRGVGNGQFNYPTNAAIDKRNGDLYVVDTQNFRVEAFTPDGKFIRKFGQLGDRPGMFSRPKGIAVDNEGHIYVADAAFNNFQIFNSKGHVLLFIGGGGATPGFFEEPAGMYMDAKDRLYAVDVFNHRVQVFQFLSKAWRLAHAAKFKEYTMLKPAPKKSAPKKAAVPVKSRKKS